MLSYFKRKIDKKRLRETFREYGHTLKTFELPGIGRVQYAQWLHPFETPKEITDSMVRFYRKFADPGAMIIDIGAHTGDTTVPMALAVGKAGLVLALEPNPYVYKVLEANAGLNPDQTRIVPLCVAATPKDGTFTFNYSDASFCNGGFLSRIARKRHGHRFPLEVTGKNLQNLLQERFADDLAKLALIKVDAEGFDKEILKSLPVILERYKPKLLVECYKRLTREERHELFDVMNDHGYNLFRLNDFAADAQPRAIRRDNMTDHKHFEILAIHASQG